MDPRAMRMESGEGSTRRNFIICTVHLRVIKSRRLRLAGHVARLEDVRSGFRILTVNIQERDF